MSSHSSFLLGEMLQNRSTYHQPGKTIRIIAPESMSIDQTLTNQIAGLSQTKSLKFLI